MAHRNSHILLLFLLMPISVLAQSELDSMLLALPDQNGKERIRTLVDVNFQLGRTDPQKAAEYAKEAMRLSEGMNDPAMTALATNALAIVAHRAGDFPEAVKYNKWSLGLRETLGDSAGVASSCAKLAVAYNEMTILDTSLHYHLRTMKIYEAQGDSIHMGQTAGNMSRVYELLGDLDEGIMVAKKGVTLLQNGPPYLKGMAVAQLSNLYLKNKQYPEAIRYGEEAMELLEKVGAKSAMAGLANNLGVIHRDNGNSEQGAFYYRKAYEMAEAVGDQNGATHYRINLANVLTDQGRHQEALDLYYECLKLSEANNYGRLKVITLEGMVLAMERTGRATEALQLQKRLYAFQDSLLSTERSEQLAEMEVKYETERTERELAEEREVTAMQEAEIDRQKLNRTYLLGGGALLALLGALFYFQQRARHRSKLQQRVITEREKGLKAAFDSAEAERRRIAQELHDGVGQQLGGLRHRLEAMKSDQQSEDLNELMDIVKDTTGEVRSIAHQMMPKALADLGLAPAIGEMLKRTFSGTNVRASFDHHGVNGDVPKEVEVGVYRIAQELVNNIVKHAKAEHIQVLLHKAKGDLVMLVEDDGTGIGSTIGDGIGQRNMRDRARAMNASLEIGPGPERGTVATLRVPFNGNGT